MLDASEYLHLAIHASRKGDHHAALNYLNQALDIEPANAALIYFQAAEHAELGLFERACAGMQNALALDGKIDIARFQLGLLQLQLQRPEQARQCFSELMELTTDDSLRTFSAAYVDLLDNEPEAAAAKLETGIATCTNAALTADMTRILDTLRQERVSAEPAGPTDDSPVFLGAYRELG